MKFLRRFLSRRFGALGAFSDVAMVAAAATRAARKSGPGRSGSNPGEWLLVAGAALRLFRRIRRVRRNRRAAGAVDIVTDG